MKSSSPAMRGRSILSWFGTGPDLAVRPDRQSVDREYRLRRWSVFLSITLGYAFFYVCRMGLSIVKKPLIDAGILNAQQLGSIGSAFLVAYAFGKFSNGFLADRSNIRKFMAAGLVTSALISLVLGFNTSFIVFLVLWGINGWFQSMGSAPSIVSLMQWFSNRERGTYYGIWFVSHNIGEGLTFVITSILVSALGWRWGLWGPGIFSLLAGVTIFFTLSDRPQTYGLPPVREFRNDFSGAPPAAKSESLWDQQLLIFRFWPVWVLGLASALTYVSRYAVNNWGMLYLQEVRSYSMVEAGKIIGASSAFGFLGAILSGVISDRVFRSSRHATTLVYGLLQIGALAVFFAHPPGAAWVDYACMAVFGFAISGTVIFLGGLTAVDLCPQRITGAVMGFIGLFSYFGAAAQDWVSGYLLESGKIVLPGGGVTHDFGPAAVFWVGASVVSIALATTVWRAKPLASPESLSAGAASAGRPAAAPGGA